MQQALITPDSRSARLRRGSARPAGGPRDLLALGPALRTEGAAAPSSHTRSPDQTCWRVDETTVRVKGRWCHLYRAINATGTTINFGPDLATASQDLNAEHRRHGLFRRGTQMLSSTEGSLSMQPREQVDTGVDVGSNELL